MTAKKFPPFVVIPGGRSAMLDRSASPLPQALTCRVCAARDGIDSWGAITLIKPFTDGRRITGDPRMLLCARCFQLGIRTPLTAVGAIEL